MTTTPSPAHSQPQQAGASFPRKSRWMLFRIFLGLGGAALVLLPIASGNNYILSIAGLIMFVVAILLLPAKPRVTVEEKARELGALATVDGGRYRFPDASSSARAQLFVASDRISVLDAKFRVLLEIPAPEITSFVALQAERGWFLEILWGTHAAEFSYRGDSAERLARAAENALRSVTPAAAPVAPHRRAAGA